MKPSPPSDWLTDGYRSLTLPPERHPPAAAGPVPLYDGPGPGPDSGHRDSQTLCLQPAGGGAHSGTAKLALPQGHLRDARQRRAGRPKMGF